MPETVDLGKFAVQVSKFSHWMSNLDFLRLEKIKFPWDNQWYEVSGFRSEVLGAPVSPYCLRFWGEKGSCSLEESLSRMFGRYTMTKVVLANGEIIGIESDLEVQFLDLFGATNSETEMRPSRQFEIDFCQALERAVVDFLHTTPKKRYKLKHMYLSDAGSRKVVLMYVNFSPAVLRTFEELRDLKQFWVVPLSILLDDYLFVDLFNLADVEKYDLVVLKRKPEDARGQTIQFCGVD